MRIIESDEDAQATHPSKLDKEPLLESIYQEVTGGAPVKSLSPHRVMQASKTALLCCLYMGIGRSLLESWVDRESLRSVLFLWFKLDRLYVCILRLFIKTISACHFHVLFISSTFNLPNSKH